MDIRGFQVWLSAVRGLTRASGARRSRYFRAGARARHRRQRSWCGRGSALRTARARGRFRATLPVQGLRHLQRARYAAVGLAPQGTRLSFGASLAKGETVKASAARCDVAVSTAFRWRHRFLAAARSDSEVLNRGSGRDLRPGEPEGRARAWTQGTAAGRQGEEARPLARAGAGSHERRRSAGAAQGRCGRSRSMIAKDALLVSDGGASHLAPPRSG